MILRAAFATLVLSILLALGIWMSDGEITRAEDGSEWVQTNPVWQKFTYLKGGEQLDPGFGPWMYGNSVEFSKFDAKESMFWFADFVLAPERAANRKVMHLYDLNAIPPDILMSTLKVAMTADFIGNMALVTYAPKEGLFIGLPIAYVTRADGDIDAALNVPSDLDLKAFINEAMKGGEWKSIDLEFSNQLFLAVDEPIEAVNIEAESFVTDSSAWPSRRSVER